VKVYAGLPNALALTRPLCSGSPALSSARSREADSTEMMLSALHPDVRFAPKSGHWLSVPGCPLWVKSTEEQRKTEV